ncbi:short chain dehydrogenase [Siphonobacter sp. BAB-5385]|uniref:SDR family oxidoreductase n=1 Tax=unclassified Siphonobacter TaxID=2635712 RepID=UPI000B9DDEFA|nr:MULTISPECIES: SDR family oxidoreductase [unclassified Siphonobacter]OZI09231.1 short chain dehydrogenase [Siphonobacter sp. BAB-5385]PMD99071.1 short chain dehydrogenase [Siphonobacter sp. BAB-5405]
MKDKVVLITGGSSGIGKALAVEFGRKGSKVVITGRDAGKLGEVEKLLKSEGISCLSLVADVSIQADHEAVMAAVMVQFGQLDVLINNAGISMRAMFEDLDPEVIRKVMDINFFGSVYATKAALPHLLQSKGSIVGISSIAGYRGLPVRVGYSASKFALNGFLEALRTELLHSGVHVLTASPGFTASNIRVASLGKDGRTLGETMRDEATMMSAEEVAARIYKAIVQRKRELILTSQGKLTVWLNKLFPKFMDTMVYNELAKEENSPLRKR